MSTAPRSSLGSVAALATSVSLALGWWADSSGIRDGARHGLGGAPVDVTVTADGGRVLVAAADDSAAWVLDAATGRRLDRQPLDGAPLRFVPMRSLGRPMVLFDASTEVCAVHPFRERTLASCFEPGEPDVTDEHDPTPEVIGAVEDPDGALIVALARRDSRRPAVRLRRYVAEGGRRWLARGDSPWLSVPPSAVHAGRSAMATVGDPQRTLLALPGLGKMLLFSASLALEAEVSVGPDPIDVVVDDDGRFAFLVDGHDTQLRKVELRTAAVVAFTEVGGGAQDLSYDGTGRIVWVAARHSGVLEGVSAESLAHEIRVPVREGTSGVAADPPRRRLIATNPRYGSVTSWVIDRSASTRAPSAVVAWQVTLP